MTLISWLAILACLSQSGMLSGLNLGLFSLSRLELQVEARKGNPQAREILALRRNANFALVTILWGNVGVNVLLALVTGSVMSGVAAFLFSTVVITIFAEIIPQAYFSRHALTLAARLAPILRLYQIVLYPVARPSAWLLDRWLGKEAVRYFQEHDLRRIIRLHMEAEETDISVIEGQGALNFLDIDDIPLNQEGEPVDPQSVISIEFQGAIPVFPPVESDTGNDFLQTVNRSGKSWVVLVDQQSEPRLLLSANTFLREALFNPAQCTPLKHCHRPLIIRDERRKLGELLREFQLGPFESGEEILENDVMLLWTEQPRVLTGSDILGRLLRGIARQPEKPAQL